MENSNKQSCKNFIKTIWHHVLKIVRGLHREVLKAAWQIFSCLPLHRRKIVFSNFNGGGFGDNPKFIAEELLARIGRGEEQPFEIYWMCADPGSAFPEGITPVKPASLRFVYHMATAHFWVDNTRKLYYFKKRPGQYYIQTWHGGPGLKMVEQDVEHSISAEYLTYAKRDSRYIDLFLSCCRWCSDLYHRAFWYDGALLERGIPKNDVYFKDSANTRAKVCNTYAIRESDHLVMYAPTYRDDRSTDMYRLDYHQVLNALSKKFGGTWTFLVRLHPNCVDSADIINEDEHIKNATLYDNMQELLVACDLIISDYSGCAFDYLMLKRPGFLYAEDYEKIKKIKNYYFSLEELPFTLAFSNEQLLHDIENFDQKEYEKKCDTYLEGIGYFDDGHASKAAVDAIIQRC